MRKLLIWLVLLILAATVMSTVLPQITEAREFSEGCSPVIKLEQGEFYALQSFDVRFFAVAHGEDMGRRVFCNYVRTYDEIARELREYPALGIYFYGYNVVTGERFKSKYVFISATRNADRTLATAEYR